MRKITLMLSALTIIMHSTTFCWKPASAYKIDDSAALNVEDNGGYIKSYIRNKTPYAIVFRAVGDTDGTDIPTEPFTLQPGEYIPVKIFQKGYTSHPGSDYHIDIDLFDKSQTPGWIENARLSTALDPNYGGAEWGAGQRVWWGVQFFGNPRGNFVIKDKHLLLAEGI